MSFRPQVVATWCDDGNVYLWNIEKQVKSLKERKTASSSQQAVSQKPLFAFSHATEGFAMSWSPHVPGLFASGDNSGKIYIWRPVNGGASWEVSSPLTGHTSSVEDIQWKQVIRGR